MGGRGSGSGFRASAGGQGEMPTGRTIADDLTKSGVEARMRILLGSDLTRESAERLSNAGAVARTWGRTARAIKTAGFTDAGFGTWEFDADAHSGGGRTEIGAQILQGEDRITGEKNYEMITWTGADAGTRRLFATRAAAMKAARVEMQVRLSKWARQQPLG